MRIIKRILTSNLAFRFIYPMIIGITLGLIATISTAFYPIVIAFNTYAEVFTNYLEFIAPIIIIIYLINAIVNLQDNFFIFLSKYFIVILISSGLIALIVTFVSYALEPVFSLELFKEDIVDNFQEFETFFSFNFPKIIGVFQAVILAFISGIIIKIAIKMKKINKLNFLNAYQKVENAMNIFLLNSFKYLVPPWIIGTYATNFYGFNLAIVWLDLFASFVVLLLQYGLIFGLIYLVARFRHLIIKNLINTAIKVNIFVTSIAGIGTGVIVPFMVAEQKKINLDESVAKFVSSASFNMPGSLISHIVFAFATATYLGVNVSFSQLLLYGLAVMVYLVIAPAIPGGVFTVTQSLLPILGFQGEQLTQAISVMGSMYWKQGTSNSAINNTADLYVTPLLTKRKKK